MNVKKLTTHALFLQKLLEGKICSTKMKEGTNKKQDVEHRKQEREHRRDVGDPWVMRKRDSR